MYPVQPHQIITDEQFDSFVQHGYLILPRFIRGEELATLQAAQRRVLKSWEQVKDNVPNDRGNKSAMFVPYPPPDVTMASLYPHPELLKLGKRYLESENLQYRVGQMFARYPGFVSHDTGHIDNGNNSLLPMSESDRQFSQVTYWIHLEEVTENDAPICFGSLKDGQDSSKVKPFVCPAGSIGIFTTYTWHKSSSFLGKEGQRLVWAYGLGRADNHFEGYLHYTSIGLDPTFKQVISNATAEERCLFRFPPPNHPYYTKQTLAALEKQYPGFNARGEYKPMD